MDNIDSRLSLINYILRKYDRNDKLVNDVINFIKNYQEKKVLIHGLETDGENSEMTNYIALFLNDSMTDENIYNLCLDTIIFVSNYSTILNRTSNNIIQTNKILTKVQ